MARFSHSSYSFDKSNTNYINAIATYNKSVFIEKINGRDVSNKGYSGADLSKALETINAEEINIETVTSNSRSTVGVIPAVDKDRLLTAMPRNTFSEAESAAVEKNAATIGAFFKSIVARGGFEIYIPTPKNLEPSDQSGAIFTLDILQKNHEITGAMLFPKQDTLLLQCNGENYLFQYGKNAGLYQMTMMVFDIDDGFCLSVMCYGDKVPEGDQAIRDELQEHFRKWKANNYQGVLIPADKTGFDYFDFKGYLKMINAQKEQSAPAATQSETTDREKMLQALHDQEVLLEDAVIEDAGGIHEVNYGSLSFLSTMNKPGAAPVENEEVKPLQLGN